MRGPFCRALDALAVNDGGRGACVTARPLAAQDVKRVVQAVERAVVLPPAEATVDGAARRQVLGHRPPLAARAQHIHPAMHHLAHVNRSLVAAPLGAGDPRLDQRPFLVGQVRRAAQLAPVAAGAVLNSPRHAAFPKPVPPDMGSQQATTPHCDLGQTLRHC